MSNQQRAQWGSRLGFVLAAAGSAVGLGNIWKFPYITGENGGGLFVLIYLVCIALVGIPIMMAEIMIGRAAQKQPVAAFHELQGGRTPWAVVGWLGVICGFLILSFYIVVAGWSMDYTLKSVVNFTDPIHKQAEKDAVAYRASASIDEMRQDLVARAAEKDRQRKDEEWAITARVKPSAWEDHELYANALVEANVIDVVATAAKHDAWEDQPTDVRAALGVSPPSPTTISDDDRAAYEVVRAILFERQGFGPSVEAAEAQLADLEAAKRDALLRAKTHYDELAATDPASLRSEAEDLHRRRAVRTKVEERFISLITDGWTASIWAAVFMFITIIIVAGGIARGIERTCRILMPTLIVLMMFMVVYGMFQPGAGEALSFVFKPDVSRLEPSGVLEALGHAFFTLSLGMGAMITYGSYQRSKERIASQSLMIAGLDTAIALLACLMIFPIIFSYDQDAGAGPGLVFMSMPLAFAEIGQGGMLIAIVFFGLLVFAALTSSISLLEVVASYFIDEKGWSRGKAAWILGGVVFLVALPSAFALDGDQKLVSWTPSFGQNFFDTMDYLTSNWMLPLGGLFIAIYAGWIMPKRMVKAEVQDLAPGLFTGWLILVRFVAPALVIVVLLQKVGLLDANELLHGLLH